MESKQENTIDNGLEESNPSGGVQLESELPNVTPQKISKMIKTWATKKKLTKKKNRPSKK